MRHFRAGKSGSHRTGALRLHFRINGNPRPFAPLAPKLP